MRGRPLPGCRCGPARPGLCPGPGRGQSLVLGRGRPVRGHPELAFQDRGAPVIGLQRRGPVPGPGLQPQQAAVPDFLERFEVNPSAGQLDRRRVGLRVLLQRDQLIQQGEAAAVQAVPLGGGPVVVERGHELAPVRPHRLRRGPPERGGVGRLVRRRRGVGGGLEDLDIQTALGVEPPQQGAAVRGQPPVHLRQARAQRVQLTPQVRPGLGVRGRPELGGGICRCCGASRCTSRKPSSAIARGDRSASTTDPSSVTRISPSRDMSSTTCPPGHPPAPGGQRRATRPGHAGSPSPRTWHTDPTNRGHLTQT